MNDDRQAGRKEIGGGGEWTALREALNQHYWRDGKGCLCGWWAGDYNTWLEHAIPKLLEALAAAAPAPPACPVKGISCDAPCKDYPRCAAQDGQGAELLGPPSKAERGVATATDGLSARARLQAIYDSHPYEHETTIQGYVRLQNQVGSVLESLPEAVAGNASAPVGEKVRDTESFTRGRHWELAEYENHLRSHNPQIGGVCSWCKLETQWGRVVQPQPSGVGEPREPKTARELAEALCDCADRTLNGRARELANELREELLEVCRDWTRTVLAREVGEGLGEVAPDLKVPFQKLLTVLLIQDRSQEQASTDVATIKKNDSTVLRIGSEMYFHQLRLECAKDSTLLDKIAVFYRDENNVLHSVGLRFEDELRWPPGFLQEALDLELAIRQVRHPALAAPAPKPAPPQHTDDVWVDGMAQAMKLKLAQKRGEGYSGWDQPAECSVEHLANLLLKHMDKPDMIDIANFAMMLHFRIGGGDALVAAFKLVRRAAERKPPR